MTTTFRYAFAPTLTGTKVEHPGLPDVYVTDDGHVEIGDHRVPADEAVAWMRFVVGSIKTATSPLTTHVDLGAAWIERDGQQVRVDFEELLPLVRSLLVHRDALGDAR